ncbi:MAG TPA: hypothetical protein VJT15_01605 [Pyrinomonadaceae bacterium]|nr:hypothetical protein [Pyrinomonadaceae bacterium]
MTLLAVICLVVLTVSPSIALPDTRTFEKARRIGEANQRSFFLFSTATGKYAIRHDGFGEVSLNGRRRVFQLKLGMAGRVEQVYFGEYQGDVLLLYEVSDGRGALAYLARMNQQTRKTRWLTEIGVDDIGPCPIEAGAAHCGGARIDLTTGVNTTD